jgi:hypothetical protein
MNEVKCIVRNSTCMDGVASDAGPKLGTKPESVDAQKGTMLDIFARCLKKKIAQVCTLLK